MRFQDRGVMVTGGSSGIGQQVCHAVADEGARVSRRLRLDDRQKDVTPHRTRPSQQKRPITVHLTHAVGEVAAKRWVRALRLADAATSVPPR
jgi:NAD(P)-dependent dehydrogenase (short-subunit alcohol dehydrogenase family)